MGDEFGEAVCGLNPYGIMSYEAVVMGASAGGLSALQEILRPLPRDFRLPILIVQHRWPAQEDLMTFALNEASRLQVKEAELNEFIQPARVYLAPANYHLLVEQDRWLSLSVDEKVCYSRPSIDVLFETGRGRLRRRSHWRLAHRGQQRWHGRFRKRSKHWAD